MKARATQSAAAILALGLTGSAHAQAWIEVGDAPEGVPANQSTSGAGALTSIIGVINRPAGDHVDTYCIVITDVAQFYATTKVAFGGSATLQTGAFADTRLWLWDANGNILLGNDDVNTAPDTFGSLVSDRTTFTGHTAPSGTVNPTANGINLVAGQTYLLSISQFPNDPDGAGGVDLANLSANLLSLHGPNPGAGPFVAWENGASTAIINYRIALRGAAFCTDPTVHAGACCLPSGNCREDTQQVCEAAGGSYQGDGTICADVSCIQPDRVDASTKGSLLIYPKVELRWTSTGTLIQDTFIDIANDFPQDVRVQMYFINGDPRILAPSGFVLEPGWNNVDNLIELTANEPTYWSAATGLPKGVSPFTVLDPGTPPGRIDPTNHTQRMLRGFIIAFAVDELGREIRWNHLKGDAVLVNYALGSAWEYNAYSFAVVDHRIVNGQQTGTPGEINMDGFEYARGFAQLLLDFYAVGSSALSGPSTLVTVDTDLTLHPIDVDLRQETDGPVTTKASFDIWNMNEVKFSGTDHCITCWDQTLLSNYGLPNHFFLVNLQTDKGRARIDGLQSILCPAPGFPGGIAGGPDNGSLFASLLGVKATHAVFDGGAGIADAGTNLHGLGHENAKIRFDYNEYPPSEAAAPDAKSAKPKRRSNRRNR